MKRLKYLEECLERNGIIWTDYCDYVLALGDIEELIPMSDRDIASRLCEYYKLDSFWYEEDQEWCTNLGLKIQKYSKSKLKAELKALKALNKLKKEEIIELRRDNE